MSEVLRNHITIGQRLKSVVPNFMRPPIRLTWQTVQAGYYYGRGKKILWDYSRHYRAAQHLFKRTAQSNSKIVSSVRDVGVRVMSVENDDNLIALPPHHLDLVDAVAKQTDALFQKTKACSFFPDLPEGFLPERITDIPAVKDGEVMMIRLKDPLSVSGLEDLSAPLMRQIEQKVYGAQVLVEKVYLYRSPVSRQSRRVSWLWHFDNHPYEVLKVLIYLTDVDSESAPFEYLCNPSTMKGVHGVPIAPLYGNSRVSDAELERLNSQGFRSREITGPKGTVILFDNDVIHRANLGAGKHRDVLILQIRPTKRRLQPYIDRRWTGSFQHADFNVDPNDFSPSFEKLHYFKE